MSTTEQNDGKMDSNTPVLKSEDSFKLDMKRRIEERKVATPKPPQAAKLPENPGIWLFSSPRTASNLFLQMMDAHSDLNTVQYEFFWGGYMPNREKHDIRKMSEEEKVNVKDLFENALHNLIHKTEQSAKEGKKVLVKEHTFMCMDRSLLSELLNPSDNTKATSSLIEKLPIGKMIEDKDWTLRMPGELKPRERTTLLMLPDTCLRAWLPLFLIRHPALMVASQIRISAKVFNRVTASDPYLRVSTSYFLARTLYDWYKKHGVPAADQYEKQMRNYWPMVLDAEDIVRDKAVMDKFCKATGLNPNEVQYEWPSKSVEEVQNLGILGHFSGTLMLSSGLNVDLHQQNVDIDKETEKWTMEYGEEVAKQMRQLTEDAMPDYLYLRERRLRP